MYKIKSKTFCALIKFLRNIYDKLNILLFRKKEPDTFNSSARTITTFCPDNICFATMDANRPIK
jgi:hypothetical protein